MKKCIVCKCDISNRGNNVKRCRTCQSIYERWRRKKYDWKRKTTKLGGKPLGDDSTPDGVRKILEKIRKYKYVKALPNKCFKRGNEACK